MVAATEHLYATVATHFTNHLDWSLFTYTHIMKEMINVFLLQ